MKKEQQYIDKLKNYYHQTVPFLHEKDQDEWMYLLKEVLSILNDLMVHQERYVVSAMYYIVTSNKDYTFEEQETYYRTMRVWTRLNTVKVISIEIIDLLIDQETNDIDEEAFHDLLDIFEESDIFGIKLYDASFTMDDLFQLQKEKKVNRERIEYIEGLFFEGRLTKHPEALDIAYTILLVEPFAYHVLIFVMDQVLNDAITDLSISFLEAFVQTFEQVEKHWIKQQPHDLTKPSDLREYCFGLSSIAMFYLEEENYELAIRYYEKLLKIDLQNVFHAKEYILRAYMFNNQFDRYSDILESLPDISVYKRFLLLYRKIQLLEDDMEEYLEETIKHYGYLFQLLIDEKESDLSALPEIEEDFLIEYGSLFLEDEEIVKLIKDFLKKYNFTA